MSFDLDLAFERIAAIAPGLIWKSTLLLAIAEVLALGLRRRSAAARHLVFFLALAGVLGLPLLSIGVPGWDLRVLPPVETTAVEPTPVETAPEVATAELIASTFNAEPDFRQSDLTLPRDRAFPHVEYRGASQPTSAPLPVERPAAMAAADEAVPPASDPEPAPAPAPPRPLSFWLVGAWGLVAIFLCLPPLVGRFLLSRLARQAVPLTSCEYGELLRQLSTELRVSRSVTLLRSYARVMPMTWGWLRPMILLPAESTGWSEDRRRSVLMHELAHVRRRDWLSQTVAQFACALYWFNPLAWLAARMLRIERERACDDLVLSTGARPSDYAEHLLEMARDLRTRRGTSLAALAIAQPSHLERRLLSILDPARRRGNLGRMTALAALVLVVATTVPLGIVRLASRITEVESNDASTEAAAPNPEEADGKSHIALRGSVFDPNGKPLLGAMVYALRSTGQDDSRTTAIEVVAQTTTDVFGGFSFSLPHEETRVVGASDFANRSYQVVAVADGFGLDWEPVDTKAKDQELVLRLAADSVPIMGRILDLEGKPVTGVRVRIKSIATSDSKLEEWVAEAKKNPAPLDFEKADLAAAADEEMEAPEASRRALHFPNGKQLSGDRLPGFTDVVSDAEGRFKIVGVGKDRLATLVLAGETIARTWLDCVTHSMQPVSMVFADPRYRTPRYFGATFDYSAEPTQIVTGVVRDADSGQPLPGVRVAAFQFAESTLSLDDYLTVATDAEGRYRIVGLPKGSGRSEDPVRLKLVPDVSQPYFVTTSDVPGKDGLTPIVHDVALKRAGWLTGRIVDKATGESVPALVSYYPFLDNHHAAQYANFNPGIQSLSHEGARAAAADGTYRIPAIAGRGVVMAVALDDQSYDIAAGAEEIGFQRRRSSEEPRLVYHIWSSDAANSVRKVEIDEQAAETACDIALFPHEKQTIRLRDPEGKPLPGVIAGGLLPRTPILRGYVTDLHNAPAAVDDTITLVGLESDRRRLLLLIHKERQLGLAAVVEHQETSEVRLEACATISGLVIGRDGKPVSRLWVSATIPESEFPGPRDLRSWRYAVRGVSTDGEGRFKLDSILPGVRYELAIKGAAPIKVDLVKPGAEINLGTVTTKEVSNPHAEATAMADEKSASAATFGANGESQRSSAGSATSMPANYDATFTFAGTVVDSVGKPVAGAKLHFDYWRKAPPAVDAPATPVTDANGEFRFSRKRSDFADGGESRSRIQFGMVATKDGYGFAYGAASYFETTGRLDAEMSDADRATIERLLGKKSTVLELVPDDLPIRGRILNTEGRPVVGARVEALNIYGPSDGKTLDAWEAGTKQQGVTIWSIGHIRSLRVTGYGPYYGNDSGDPRPVVVPPTLTDADGWFTLKGLGRERLAQIFVSGSGIETTAIRVRSRRGEIIKLPQEPGRADRGDDTIFPCDFTCAVGPSVPLTGHVTDRTTGRPIAGALVRAEKIATVDVHGALEALVIRCVTDADGRYRLDGLPLGENVLFVIPQLGTNHLAGATRVVMTSESKSATQDVALTAGIIVRGTVTDGKTGKPVQGNLKYFAFASNPHWRQVAGFRDADLDHYYRSDAQGRYEIPVLPGQGLLAFRADDVTAYPQGVGADRIQPSPRKETNFEFFDTEPNNCVPGQHNFLMALDPPAETKELTVNLSLRAGAEVPLRIVRTDGRAVGDYYVCGEFANSYWSRQQNETLRIKGYFPDRGRRLMVYQPEGNLIGLHDLIGQPPEALEIKLRPGAKFLGRVIDADGVPVENAQIGPDWGTLDPNSIVVPGEAGDRGSFFTNPEGRRVVTDATGRFELNGIIPGLKYSAYAHSPGGEYIETLFTDRTAESGETKDLGNLQPKPYNRAAATTPTPVDTPIRGRLLDIEGKPIVGVKVETVTIWVGTDGSLDAWEAVAKKADGDFPTAFQNLRLVSEAYQGASNITWRGGGGGAPAVRTLLDATLFLGGPRDLGVPAVQTDKEGWFTIKELGRDRIAEVVVSGPGIETLSLYARSRPGEVIKLPRNRQSAEFGAETFHPAEFTLVCGPSVPVEGRVADDKTGAPLAGIRVQSENSLRTRTVTDAEGRYRLEGLPVGANSSLYVLPPAGSRYLFGRVGVKTTSFPAQWDPKLGIHVT